MNASETSIESVEPERDSALMNRCTEVGDDGRRCEAPAEPGQLVCSSHTPEAMAAFRRRVAEKQATRCGYRQNDGTVCLAMPVAEGRCERHTLAALERQANIVMQREAEILAKKAPRVLELEKKIEGLERAQAAATNDLRALESAKAEMRHQLDQGRRELNQAKSELKAVKARIKAELQEQKRSWDEVAQKAATLIQRSVDILSQPEVTAEQRALADSLRESAKECRLMVDFAQRRGRLQA